MAENPGRMSELLKSLEEEVKCPVCMEIFTKPKKLSCDHILCTPCLENVILKSSNKSITCPVCRASSSLQESDASQFPTAHQVNRLIDIYQKTLEEQAPTSIVAKETSQHPFCSLHSSQPLALYCETCKKTVCRDCVIFSCSKMNHQFDLMEVFVKKHKAEVDTEATHLKKCQEEISEILEICQADDADLQAQKLKEQENIQIIFDILVDKITEVKNDISVDMEKRFKAQSVAYQKKADMLKQHLLNIARALESTESINCEPALGKQIEKIIAQKETLRRLFSEARQVKLLETQITDETRIKIMSQHFNPKKSLLYWWPEYVCHLDKFDKLKSLQVNEHYKIDFYPNRSTIKASEVTSELICSFDNTSTSNTITELPNHAFRLSFTPQKLGKHALHIIYHGAHICGSPISTFVYFDLPPYTPFQQINNADINNASGIKCYDDKVYITLFGEEVHVMKLDKDEGLVKVNTISLPGVNEIIVHENHLYYTEILKHTLVKADLSGQAIVSTGGRGKDIGKFNSPNGIAISSTTSEIFVCDTSNHRIQVFDDSLNYLRTIGSKGKDPGQFQSPGHIVFDENSNIYVVEYSNHRVQVLTQHGLHIRFIEDKLISNPISADIFRDRIYITFGRLVSVYSLTGEFITSFGENTEYITPECVAVDGNGFIFVTYDRKGVIQFSEKENSTF